MVSYISYYYYERRFLKLKAKFTLADEKGIYVKSPLKNQGGFL
jgi:hypothetical protein